MNLQHVEAFLDLVSNPEKYKQVLTQLQEEQGRLNTCIEQVGKASELEKLIAETTKQAEKQQQSYDQKVADLEKERESLQASIKKKSDVLSKKEKAIDDKTQELDSLVAEAKAVQKSNADKEAELVQKDLVLTAKTVEVDALIAEYSEKIAKLKSVLG